MNCFYDIEVIVCNFVSHVLLLWKGGVNAYHYHEAAIVLCLFQADDRGLLAAGR